MSTTNSKTVPLKDQYRHCQEQGICYSCGNLIEDERKGKTPRCSACRTTEVKRANQRKEELSRQGLCRDCGKNPAPAEQGGRCKECYARLRTNQQVYYRRLKLEVMTHYCSGQPPSCSCCGEPDLFCLDLHHTEGGGNEHRRQVGFGPAFYRWIIKRGFPTGYAVLCCNCNVGAYRSGGHTCPAHLEHARLRALRQSPVTLTTVDPGTGAHVTLNLIGGPGCKVALPTVVADQPLRIRDIPGMSINWDGKAR